MINRSRAQEALMNYQQADEDGVMVLVSRQAIHEVSDEIERLREGDDLHSRIEALEHENDQLRAFIKQLASTSYGAAVVAMALEDAGVDIAALASKDNEDE